MTGTDASAARPSPPHPGLRVTLPASRGGLAWLVVLLVVGSFLAFQVGRQVYASWSINQEADRIRAQIQALEAENAALERELAYLLSDAYVSAEARRLRNLGRPDERVLIIPPGAEAPVPVELREEFSPPPPPLAEWIHLFFAR